MSNTKTVILGVVLVIVFVAICVGGVAGCKSFNRAQKRADAKNRTAITKQEIKTAEQKAQVVKAQIKATQAEADKRVAEAHGIREAQDLIAKTLTPMYIQHEAIQAQRFGGQGDRTYIPVGAQGVPLVADVNGESVNKPLP